MRAAPSGARAAPPRAVVTWDGKGAPIMLTLYGPDGEVAFGKLPPAGSFKLFTRGKVKAPGRRHPPTESVPLRIV